MRGRPFTNILAEIRLGSLESRIVSEVLPRRDLDAALNPHLIAPRVAARGTYAAQPLVYDPGRDTFLSGALPQVKRILRRHGVGIRLRDLRPSLPLSSPWRLRGGLELRPYQREVVETALERRHGLVDIGTGGGKTLLAAEILARLGPPAVYLVTTRTLLTQAVSNLREYLGIEPGVVGDGTCDPRGLTVALVQALDESKVDFGAFEGGTLVFDEGHHAAASSFLDLIRRLRPSYHFYLTAVPHRSSGDQVVLDALSGGSLTGGRYSAQYLIEKGYACPVEVHIETVPIRGDMTERPFTQLYREFIVENRTRNQRIADIAASHAARRRSVLVLVDHVRQGRLLRDAIPEGARLIHGSLTRRRITEITDDFAAGRVHCLIATSGLFAEGVSIDNIQVLIIAGGLKSRVKVLQSLGRGMRRAAGKRACLFVDFFDDDTAGVLRAHSRRRLAVLREEGFRVPPVPSPPAGPPPAAVQPSWTHVPGTNRFVLVDQEGRLRGRAVCLRRELVPDKLCRRCPEGDVCERGGRLLCHDDPE